MKARYAARYRLLTANHRMHIKPHTVRVPELSRLEHRAGKYRLALYALLAAYLLVYILPLGIRPLIIPDETRYAEVPREMIQRGDWVVPHLNGLRYFEKPPLGYWLNAISLTAFGENAFAVRLPSAVSAGLAAYFVGLLLFRSGYRRKTALLSAAVYLSLFEVLFAGTFAVLDSIFNLFLTGGMVLFFLGTIRGSPGEKTHNRYFIGSGLLFGTAFLSKGFLAFVIPGIVLLPWILLERRFELVWAGVRGVVAGCLPVVLPWAIMIHLREPDYWRYFIWEEHIRRFLADDAQHEAPIYYFLVYLPVLCFPWTAFLPAAFRGLSADSSQRPLIRLLLLWFALPFVFFSLSKGKLATYILPCLAPLAVIVTLGLSNYLDTGRTRLYRLGAVINIVILGLFFLAIVYLGYFAGNAQFNAYFEGERHRIAVLAALVVSAAVITGFAFGATRDKIAKTAWLALSVVPLYFAVNAALPPSVAENKSPNAFFMKLREQLRSDDIVLADGSIVRAVNWALKRDDIYMMSANELEYGLTYPEAGNRLVNPEGFADLQRRARARKVNIAVFCMDGCPGEIRARLPDNARQISNRRFTVWLIVNRPEPAGMPGHRDP